MHSFLCIIVAILKEFSKIHTKSYFLVLVAAYSAISFNFASILFKGKQVDTFSARLLEIHQLRSQGKVSLKDLQVSFLPVNLSQAFNFREKYPTKNLSFDLSTEHDPRVLPALLAYYLAEHFSNFSSYELPIYTPFSWNSWLGLDKKSIQHNMSSIHDCLQLDALKYEGAKDEILEKCSIDHGISPEYPKFRVSKPMSFETEEKTDIYVALSYMLYFAPIPTKIWFNLANNETLGIPLSQEGAARGPINKSDLQFYLNYYHRNYLDKSSSESYSTIVLKELVNKLEGALNLIRPVLRNSTNSYRIKNGIQLIKQDNMKLILDKSDFLIDLEDRQSILGNLVANDNSARENKWEKNIINGTDKKFTIEEDHSPKYFHEAKIVNTFEGTHYDWRFFRGIIGSHAERQTILHELVRAWSRFAHNSGIETWIAHGSLLGWYWNGMSLPWDSDVDVQVTTSGLLKLAEKYNNSLVLDMTDSEDINLGLSSYYIDVNKHILERKKGNGHNNIDARFIDTSSGMYIDITALAYTDAVKDISIRDKDSIEFNRLLDPDFVNNFDSTTIDKDKYFEMLSNNREKMHKERVLFNCKNNHFYTAEELSPLKVTLFEGTRVAVPSNFRNILNREYKHGLYSRSHEGYTFHPKLRLWVKTGTCNSDNPSEKSCDKLTLLEYLRTKSLTDYHKQEFYPPFMSKGAVKEIKSIRWNPWILKRYLNIHSLLQKDM